MGPVGVVLLVRLMNSSLRCAVVGVGVLWPDLLLAAAERLVIDGLGATLFLRMALERSSSRLGVIGGAGSGVFSLMSMLW